MKTLIEKATWTLSSALALILIGTGPIDASVVPAALFSDNAVLQADHEVPVWGWDDAGQKVTVSIGSTQASGTADKDGRWQVTLPAMKAGDTAQDMTIAGSSTVTVKNVLVGEVWLGSGQSNMAMPVDWGAFGTLGTPEFTAALNDANHPNLRMFKVEERNAGEPAKDVKGTWQICSSATVLKWSAAGYFFSRDLQKELGGTPVGFINSSVGGTQLAPWVNLKAYLAVNPSTPAFTQSQWAASAQKIDDFNKEHDAWSEAAAQAKASGGTPPAEPKRPTPWPGCLYEGMIAPLMPYSIRGIIWYQGESNTYLKDGPGYGRGLEALVKTWREDWKLGDLPFIIVQLPNFSQKGGYTSPNCKPVQADPVESDAQWPPVREAQRLATVDLPNMALLVTIDIGDPNKIHPPDKADLGHRGALLAMNHVYGKKDLVASGPLFSGCAFKDGKAVVSFTSVGGGLAAKDGGDLKGFAMAGSDGKFVWAKAAIEGSTVVLSADEVKDPTAVRYSWAENPIGNLINKEGLPASPFKTDEAAPLH